MERGIWKAEGGRGKVEEGKRGGGGGGGGGDEVSLPLEGGQACRVGEWGNGGKGVTGCHGLDERDATSFDTISQEIYRYIVPYHIVPSPGSAHTPCLTA